jgi:hypothetical protein
MFFGEGIVSKLGFSPGRQHKGYDLVMTKLVHCFLFGDVVFGESHL